MVLSTIAALFIPLCWILASVACRSLTDANLQRLHEEKYGSVTRTKSPSIAPRAAKSPAKDLRARSKSRGISFDDALGDDSRIAEGDAQPPVGLEPPAVRFVLPRVVAFYIRLLPYFSTNHSCRALP